MSFQSIWRYFKFYLFGYLITSLIFSLINYTKLAFLLNITLLNILLYDIYYYVMPSVAIIFLLVLLDNSNPNTSSIRRLYSLVALSLWLIAFSVLFFVDSCLNIPYCNVTFPLILPVVCSFFKPKISSMRKLAKYMVIAILSLILITPYVSAFLGLNYAISVIKAIGNENDRARFVSQYIRAITISFWGLQGLERKYVSFHRALRGSCLDFQKFLMVGVGSCGEMARATKLLLDDLGIESRLVSFAGEDHMFVEVRINDKWLVLDPGYQLNLITRDERGTKRLEEIGGLSYVVGYTNRGFVELTQQYVSTDKIVIKVLNDGEPIANAKIVLKHIFMGHEQSLPEFYSDINGVVEINLGPLSYNNSKIEPAEPYYWIYVNGRNTHLKVSSTGSGKTTYIEVDLTCLEEP